MTHDQQTTVIALGWNHGATEHEELLEDGAVRVTFECGEQFTVDRWGGLPNGGGLECPSGDMEKKSPKEETA
jgi:hypothetical protein